MQSTQLFRVGRQILMALLIAAIVTWVMMAPLIWILRDGLGPGMVETNGAFAIFKFAVQWSVPATILALPLLVLWLLERRDARSATNVSLQVATAFGEGEAPAEP